MGDAVTLQIKDGLAKITLARPESRNALSFELARSLNNALGQVAADASVRVALLLAEGKAFCAGMDLKNVALDDPKQASDFANLLAESYRGLLLLPVPLLCAADGPAMGGAVGLALAADLLWVGERARFAFPETKVGIVPALVSVVARRRLASGRLNGLLLAGIAAGPHEAVRLGLADFEVEGEAAGEAEDFAKKLMRENSDEAMRRTKAFLQSQFANELDQELSAAIAEFNQAVATKAAARGLDAFQTKSSLVWTETPEGDGV